MPDILSVQHLSIRYGGREAVHDISFTLEKGKAFSIVGESGCGKSTLLRAMMRVLPEAGEVTGGDVLFHGASVFAMKPAAWRRICGRQVAMLFQQPGSAFHPTRKLGLQFRDFLRAHGAGREAWRERALDALKEAGFADGGRILESFTFELSGGMRQRAAVALALAVRPEAILMDEPTSALDAASILSFLDLMKTYLARGTAILFVTHNIRAAAYLAEDFLIMRDGHAIEQGGREEIVSAPHHPYTRQLFDAVPEVK